MQQFYNDLEIPLVKERPSILLHNLGIIHNLYVDPIFIVICKKVGSRAFFFEILALDPLIASHHPKGLSAHCHHLHCHIFTVPGYCYTCLFTDEWFFLAIATLGPYPLAADMAHLSAYFSQATSSGAFAFSSLSATRHGFFISHICGHDFRCQAKVIIYDPVSCLHSMGNMVISTTPNQCYFPISKY